MLGSRRGTSDVDIVVPDGRKQEARGKLAQSGAFGTGSDSSRTWYNATDGQHYNVDILEPGSIYQRFGGTEDTLRANGFPILRPMRMLDFKCFSWASEDRRMEKRNHDARDIMFLLDHLARNGERVRSGELQFAGNDFLYDFVARYPESKANWRAIGVRAPSL